MDIFINPIFYSYFEKYLLTLVDVGASGGILPHWRRAEKFLRRLGFEPDTQEFHKLTRSTDRNTIYLNTALHKEKASLDFYCTRKQECSSLFSPNRYFLNAFPAPDRFDVVEKVKLDTDSLDNQLGQAGVSDVDFIKIDTQGSELAILEGARTALASILGIEVEVEFSQIYDNQPLFSEVELCLRTRGFQLFDLAPCYWKRAKGMRYGKPKGQLIFADALFLRDAKTIGELLERIQDNEQRKAKLLKALAICLLYGYVDYAAELFESQAGILSPNEVTVFRAFLTKNIPWLSKFPYVPGRNKLARAFVWLSQMLEYPGWVKKQRYLGNH